MSLRRTTTEQSAETDVEPVDAIEDAATETLSRADVVNGRPTEATQLETESAGPARLIKTYALPLLIFFALSVLFTWPLVLNFGDHALGTGGSSDVWQHLWNIWWVKQAVTTLHTSPFHTDFLFYPDGVSLRFHALNQLGGLISIPFQALFGLVPAFNAMVLFNLTLAGFGAYLLARYVLTLVRSGPAPLLPCIATGIAFAYSAGEASFVRLGQLELMSIEWLPFGVLFLMRATLDVYPLPVGRESRVRERTFNFRFSTFNSSPIFHALAAGFFIVLASQHTWYYGLYLLFFAALLGIYALIMRWREGWAARLLVVRQLAIAVGFFLLAVSPLLLPMVQELRATPQLAANLNTVIYNSVELPGLFRPGPSLLWGTPVTNDSNWSISAVAGLLGLGGLIIAGRKQRSRGLAIFLAISAVFFVVLALGPYLKLQPGGSESLAHLGDNGPTIPLPFLLLYNTPIGGIARIAARYTVMGMLFVGLLTAVTLDYLLQRRLTLPHWGRYAMPALSFVLVVLMMVEAIPAGGQALVAPAQSAFFNRIGSDPLGSYTVMEVPSEYPGLYMYDETLFHQKMIGGYTSRHYDYPFVMETPVVRQLYYDAKPANEFDIIKRDLSANGQAVLNYYNVRYVVVHESLFQSESDRNLMHDVISQVWPGVSPERDGDLSIYTVAPPTTTVPPAMEFGAGWYWLERSSEQGSWRWTNGDATMVIWSPQPLTATFATTVYSYATTRHLTVALNGNSITTQEVGVAQIPLTLTLNLQGGANRLTFHTAEGPTKASAKDERMLAVGFKQINLTSMATK